MITYVNAYQRITMARHVLTVVLDQSGLLVFRLGPPRQTGLEVTRIIFTRSPLPEQIILTGDLHPGDGNGIMSPPGYGLDWFSVRKSERYLCEKFLRVGYVPDLAAAAVVDRVLDLFDERGRIPGESQGLYDALTEALLAHEEEADDTESDPFRSHEAFYQFWGETFEETPDEEGIGYDPRDAGWLCAIQQRFAELYAELSAQRSAA